MPRYSDEIIDEVRQTNDIVDIISQYVHLKRSGRNFFGLCPFHNEKSPSFSVSPDKQIFHCFGCGVGGNVFTFLTKIEGISFIEAVQTLAERSNIQLPTLENTIDSAKEELKAKVLKVNEFTAQYYHENLYKPESKIVQEYIKKRKLSNETLKSFRLGFSGRFDELYHALKKEGFQSSRSRRIGIRILGMLVSICCIQQIKDVTSGFRAVNKEFMQVFAKDYPQDYPEPESIVAVAMHKGKIAEVPVKMCERHGGESSISFGKSVYYMIKVSLAILICRISFGVRRKK